MGGLKRPWNYTLRHACWFFLEVGRPGDLLFDCRDAGVSMSEPPRKLWGSAQFSSWPPLILCLTFALSWESYFFRGLLGIVSCHGTPYLTSIDLPAAEDFSNNVCASCGGAHARRSFWDRRRHAQFKSKTDRFPDFLWSSLPSLLWELEWNPFSGNEAFSGGKEWWANYSVPQEKRLRFSTLMRQKASRHSLSGASWNDIQRSLFS